jgi:chromosomal replication initiation ATPase DnaA
LNPLLTTVATEVAKEFGSRLSAILSPYRGQPDDSRSRHIAIAVYREVAPRKMSLTDLGAVFDRDRTSVRHALERVELWRKKEPRFPSRFNRVVRNIRAKQ